MGAAAIHGGLLARCPECHAVVRVPRQRPSERKLPDGLKQATGAAYAKAGSDASPVETAVALDEAPPGEADAVSSAPAQDKTDDSAAARRLICTACGDEVTGDACVACRHCRGYVHIACWTRNGGCAVPTCDAGPNSRKKVHHAKAVEAKLRPCPVCAEMIPDRAHRCRYCGEFTDREMRKATRPHATRATKTSKLAGISLILGCIGLVPAGNFGAAPLFFLFMSALPPLSICLGIWAVKDIRRARGEKSGIWTAGFGIGIGVVGTLAWLIRLVP